jgi:hypothetical protein
MYCHCCSDVDALTSCCLLLLCCSCRQPTIIQLAVGNKGTILRYTNNKWTKVASCTAADLQGVAAVSDSLAFAVGAKVGVGCGRHLHSTCAPHCPLHRI